MRGALERAAERPATSMNAQNLANTVRGVATLGWEPREAGVRGALEWAAERRAADDEPSS